MRPQGEPGCRACLRPGRQERLTGQVRTSTTGDNGQGLCRTLGKVKSIQQRWQAAIQLGESMSQKASSHRSDGWRGVGFKSGNEGEMLPGSHSDLGENYFTGQCW